MTMHHEDVPWKRVAEVRLDLGPPSHGWLPFLLRFDDYALEASASLVLNDPVEELIDLFQFLRPMASGLRRTCLWLEPTGYAIDVQHLSREESSVIIRYDESFVPPMAGQAMSTMYRYIVPTEVLRQALYEALRILFAHPGARNQREHLESLRGKWKHAGGQVETPEMMRADQHDDEA